MTSAAPPAPPLDIGTAQPHPPDSPSPLDDAARPPDPVAEGPTPPYPPLPPAPPTPLLALVVTLAPVVTLAVVPPPAPPQPLIGANTQPLAGSH